MQGQIAEAAKLIQEPDALKAAVVKLYQMHVENTDHNRKSNVDIEQEFARQVASNVVSRQPMILLLYSAGPFTLFK